MTQPVQEPTQGRIDQGQEFRTRQLFRRPTVAPASGRRFTYILYGPTDLVEPNPVANETCENFSLPEDLDGLAVIKVEGFVSVPSSSGDVEVDVFCFFPDLGGAGISVFNAGTTLVIPQGDYTSTGATQPLYTGSAFATDNYVVMKVVDEGTDTAGLGLHLTFGSV